MVRGKNRREQRPAQQKNRSDRRWYICLRQSWGLIPLCTGLAALAVGWYLPMSHFEGPLETSLDFFRSIDKDSYWKSHQEEVKEAFITSWDAYAKHAWGHDRFHPISKTGSQMSPDGLGWMIVDSLDTLMIMNLTTELSEAREWLQNDLTYDQDQDVNTFEMTIRMLGGLLSAHYLSTSLPGVSSHNDHIYLAKAVDLADRLLGAYESRSGIPFASVNIGTKEGLPSHADGGASSTAEATTVQLEMKYLAHLIGNEIYWRKAERVMEVIDSHRMQDGLLPIFVHPDTGNFHYQEIRLGSRGDSYYEYLIKQYLQTSGQEPVYREMWEEALAGIQKHLLAFSKHSNLQYIAELPRGIGRPRSHKMDHLVCFLPGSIAIGATEGRTEAEARKLPGWSSQKEQQMRLARELMKTCWAMYAVTDSGLSPEIAWFNANDDGILSSHRPKSGDEKASWKKDLIIKPLDTHNLQRPETVESLFLMYRVTNDPIYRKWGWKIFQAFQKHTVVGDGEGYTSLHDVTKVPTPQRDNMESFWLAETLKYLYLLFSPKELLPLTEVVFNTEAHPLPRFKQTKFQTGWKRRRPS